MSTAAVMLVKDEADVVGYTVRHLLGQVDQVFVADNGSTDATKDVLGIVQQEIGDTRIILIDDDNPAYWQSAKTTELAKLALDCGHSWVVPCDADEFWYSTDGRPIRDFVDGLAPDVMIVEAELYNHIPTALDPPAVCSLCGRADGTRCHLSGCPPVAAEANPFRRLGFRKRQRSGLGKVACRLRPDLVVLAGNHDATTDGTALRSGGLCVRHFSWRSVDQYVRKIRNGEAAYKLTDLPENVGAHWRMWEGKPDEAIADNFRNWFWSLDPNADSSLIYDPPPGA